MQRRDGRRPARCGRRCLAVAAASLGLVGAALPVAATAGRRQAAGRCRAPACSATIWPAGRRSTCATSPARRSGYEKALAADPDSPELISRTFLMEVSVGQFRSRAATLAPKRAEARSERRGRPARAARRPAQGRRYRRRAEGRRGAAVGRRAPFYRARSRWPGPAWRRAIWPAPTRRCRGSTNSTASSR